MVFENYVSIIAFNSPKLKNNRFYLNVVKHLFFSYIKFILSKENLMYELIHIFADTLILYADFQCAPASNQSKLFHFLH